MGKITGRVLGNVTGKVANMTYSKWKQIYVAKALPTVRPKRKDAKPLPQNLKFKLMGSFLQHLKAAVKLGFYSRANKGTAHSLAMKHNLAHAIKGEYPDFEINFPKIKISHGNLEGAWSGRIVFEPEYTFRVSWQISELANLKIIGKDKAHILIYDAVANKGYHLNGITDRSALGHTFNFPKKFEGNTIHAWVFFISADGKTVSNSDYMGSGILIA